MLNYENFKEEVLEKLKDYLPEEYQSMKLQTDSIQKINEVLDGIHLVGKGLEVAPTLYINDMYKQYQSTNDLNKVLKDTAEKMDNAIKHAPKPKLEMNQAEGNIVFQLINTEQNKELLENIPNRSFQDLSIIYRWIIKIDDDGIQSTVINNSLAESFKLSEEQLFSLATENTKRILPPSINNISDFTMDEETPSDMLDMWVISNNRGINGASSMLYEDVLYNLAEKIGTNLYIMPSSIHECIALSAFMADPNELAKMVVDINMNQVFIEERLSNQVYYYDKDLRKVSLATDTPRKRLDQILM